MQTALGVATPVPVVETSMGPPHVGAVGWLFHLDAPNLVLTSLRPAPDGADAVTARMLEVGGFGGQAQWRCVRDPKQARLDRRPRRSDARVADAGRRGAAGRGAE